MIAGVITVLIVSSPTVHQQNQICTSEVLEDCISWAFLFQWYLTFPTHKSIDTEISVERTFLFYA